MPALVTPYPTVADGPHNANMQVPRTPIPLEGFSVTLQGGSIVAQGATPVEALPAPTLTLSGLLTRTTFDGWYNRIHIVPGVINVGNVSGDQSRPVLVWNAFFETAVLQDFSLANADGISAIQPVDTPVSVGPLRTLTYVINVSATGPSVIKATATWTIDGVDYVVPITGRRSVLFAFPPTWDQGLTETLSWSNTVNRTWSGREQRMQISKSVRRTISYTVRSLRDNERQILDSMLFGWHGRIYSLPLWQEASRLTADTLAGNSIVHADTTRMTIRVGSTIVLYRSPTLFESLEVESFTPTYIIVKGTTLRNWYAGSRVLPAVSAIPNPSLRTSRPLPELMQMGIEFLVDPAAQMLRLESVPPPETYRGIEVYYAETNWATGMDGSIVSNRRDTDGGLGVVQLTRKGPFPEISRPFSWVLRDRVRADLLRQFFVRRAGRLNPVWMPSGSSDMTLASTIDSTSSSMEIRDQEYASFVAQEKIRRDVVLLMRDGRRLARRITNSADNGDTVLLTLENGFGEEIRPEQVKRVSYLGLHRLSEDSVTFNWLTNSVATVEVDFILTEPSE